MLFYARCMENNMRMPLVGSTILEKKFYARITCLEHVDEDAFSVEYYAEGIELDAKCIKLDALGIKSRFQMKPR